MPSSFMQIYICAEPPCPDPSVPLALLAPTRPDPQEGLIKCLFATETFSIGINMPAKTVIFTQTRKFDGKDFRWLTSGEYIQVCNRSDGRSTPHTPLSSTTPTCNGSCLFAIQMSGRAGRRGKDDRGIVIQMLDEKMEPDAAKNMLYGPADPLKSAYHVSYNMVLNMLRVEDADPENLLRCSFHQYQVCISEVVLCRVVRGPNQCQCCPDVSQLFVHGNFSVIIIEIPYASHDTKRRISSHTVTV